MRGCFIRVLFYKEATGERTHSHTFVSIGQKGSASTNGSPTSSHPIPAKAENNEIMPITSKAQLAAHRAFYLYYEKDEEGNTIYPEEAFTVPSYPIIAGLSPELIDEIYRIVIHELATDNVAPFEKRSDDESAKQKSDPNKKFERKCECGFTHYGGHAWPHRIWGAFFAPLLGKPELKKVLGATDAARVEFLTRYLEEYICQRGVAEGRLVFDDGGACSKVVDTKGWNFMQIDGRPRRVDYTLQIVETLDDELVPWDDEDEIRSVLLGGGKLFHRLNVDDENGNVLDFYSVEELANRLEYDAEDDVYDTPPCRRVVQIMDQQKGWVPYHGYQPANENNDTARIVSGYALLEGGN